MPLVILKRGLKTAVKNYLRNFWLTLATVFMLILVLLIINSLVIIHFASAQAISFLQEHVAVSVYLKPETPPDQVANLKATIKNLPYIAQVNLITKDEALKQFKELHQDNATLLTSLKELDSNPLGDSLEVKAKTMNDYTPFLSFIQQPQFQKYIADKDFRNYQDLVTRLQDFTDRFRTAGLVVLAFFLIVSVLVIFNTVRMALYARREEIGIMKLVGATNFFIRLPFILETILQTLTALIIQSVILLAGFHFLKPLWNQLFSGEAITLDSYIWSYGWIFLGGEFVLLMLLTVLSSFWATQRYLRS